MQSSDSTKKLDLSQLRYLTEHIVKSISLPDFIESEAGVDIQWSVPERSAKCCCPLHEEKEPSFHINLLDEIWTFHCFGCSTSGTIVNFCKEFHSLRNKLEAIYYICQKYKIENVSDLILEGIKKVGVKIDEQRLLENANILVSNQCRMLLRRNYDVHKKWVSEAYKRLNIALKNGDQKQVDLIGYEAYNRTSLKG